MKDVLQNSRTELKIVMMNQDTNIPDEIFNPEFLEKVFRVTGLEALRL